MRYSVTFAVFVACALALPEAYYQESFVSWMQTHQKSYSHEDFLQRYQIYRSNLDFVNDFNAQEGEHHTVAMNHLGDLSSEEYKKLYLGTRISVPEFAPVPNRLGQSTNDTKDWRKLGAVTPVKNQKQCGSCWAFSSTGAVEGCHYLSTQELVSLSEQNLMDCSWSYGNNGCNGGLMESAFDYIIKNGGVDTEDSYPYTARDGKCQYDSAHSGATLTKYTRVRKGDESNLQDLVAEGPVSVAIDASPSSFQFYHSGVYYESKCSSYNLDHGVLTVGWGTLDGQDYWIVKNSWGTTWGDQGYILMSRNRNNNCGIATMATIPRC